MSKEAHGTEKRVSDAERDRIFAEQRALIQDFNFGSATAAVFDDMLVRSVPTSNQFAVALINEKGLIFMAAEVANIRQAKRERANDKPLLIVGCRFRQRLYPANETTSASMTSALVGAR